MQGPQQFARSAKLKEKEGKDLPKKKKTTRREI